MPPSGRSIEGQSISSTGLVSSSTSQRVWPRSHDGKCSGGFAIQRRIRGQNAAAWTEPRPGREPYGLKRLTVAVIIGGALIQRSRDHSVRFIFSTAPHPKAERMPSVAAADLAPPSDSICVLFSSPTSPSSTQFLSPTGAICSSRFDESLRARL